VTDTCGYLSYLNLGLAAKFHIKHSVAVAVESCLGRLADVNLPSCTSIKYISQLMAKTANIGVRCTGDN